MWDWIGKLHELSNKNQPAVLVTVIKSNGSTPRKSGAEMIVLPVGHDNSGNSPREIAISIASQLLATYNSCGQET